MRPEGSLLLSQKLATGPYPEPNELFERVCAKRRFVQGAAEKRAIKTSK
jgi:hypothetical protein